MSGKILGTHCGLLSKARRRRLRRVRIFRATFDHYGQAVHAPSSTPGEGLLPN